MKYKICVINSLYSPYDRGGAEKAAELTVAGLQEDGHKTFVVTCKPWQGLFSLLPKISEIDDVKIYRFYPLNIFSFININNYSVFFRLIWRIFDTFNFHSAFMIFTILKKEMPDFVWTHNLTGIGLLIPLVLKLLNIPHIHTLHDVALIEPSGLVVKGKEKRGFLIRLFFGNLTRRLFSSPALVVSPSKWLLDFYLSHNFFGKSKVLVKQNPTVPLQITNQYKYTNGESLNLLYIGQLEKHKGILFLISVLDELVANYNFKLFVVGTGRLSHVLGKMAEQKKWLVVCGRLDFEDTKEMWLKTSLTIVPSLAYENSPTVICESLINGVPVLASRIGGIPELVENGKNGFLFEAGDKNGIKQTLIKIFKNPQILENLAQNALTFEAKTPIIYARDILSQIINE